MTENPCPSSSPPPSDRDGDPGAGPGGAPRGSGGQPHDGLFRATLQGRPEQAGLVGALFPGLAAILEGAAFEAVDASFVDEGLRHAQSDLVLRTRLAGGGEVWVYTLVEHQRTVDAWMALRMVRYQVRIWDRYLREHPQAVGLPAILPAVIYQGGRSWTAVTEVRDLVALAPEVAGEAEAYLLRAGYRLADLAEVDLGALGGLPVRLRLSFTMMVGVPGNSRVLSFLSGLHPEFVEAGSGPDGVMYLEAVFTYIWRVCNVPFEELEEFAHTVGPHAQEALMSTADVLEARGEARGETRGRANSLLEQLDVKFGSVEEAVQARVETATTEELQNWTRRILVAESLAEVFD